MKEIIEIYLLYGFELAEETKEYLVFTYTNGYFSNAEIVQLKDVDCSKCKKKYETLAFSVTIIGCHDLAKIHDKLFSGFFSSKLSKEKNNKEYTKYCEKQMQKFLMSSYEYLNCDYAIEDTVYNSGLVDLIYNKLSMKGPQLIILEAAAGYGKTCTSFEVLRRFSSDAENRVPLMTELSKNRKASIFKYVLLSEIDNKFPALSAKVVNYEILNGNVPLLIDGFDELLSKSIEFEKEDEHSTEEAQNMLDTIAQLFSGESKAKILITSRKSAIFTGEQFDDWAESKKLSNLITRIELKPPRVRNWIGAEKEEVLKEKNIKLEYISNPILLSILRDKSKEYLKNNEISNTIEEYFSTLLTREEERQSLLLEVNEQLSIMQKLAVEFADFGISAENTEFVKELLIDITKDNIDEYISRYKYSFDSFDILPDTDEFINKLLHHALLDRVVYRNNQIGFVNEFVFGYLLGQAIVNNSVTLEERLWDYKYIDLICTAYAIDGIGFKQEVEEQISRCIDLYSSMQQLDISDKLFHCNIRSYTNEIVTDISFSTGFIFEPSYTISNCSFVNCTFESCEFFSESFYECQFYNCIFYNPIVHETIACDSRLMFLGCSGFERLAEAYSMGRETINDTDNNYERVVLEQFWKRGSSAPDRRRAFRTMYRGFDNTQDCMIDKAVKSLLDKHFLIKKTYCYELDFSKLEEIKKILGRES